MNVKLFLFSSLSILFFCSICEGQTRAVKANIRGVDIGQIISPAEIKNQFPDHSVHVALNVFSSRYRESYDYVTINDYDFSDRYGGKGSIKYTLHNGKIIRIEMLLTSTSGLDRNDFFKHLYNVIYSEYGIWDRGLENVAMRGDADTFDSDAIPAVSIQGYAGAYLWSGVNGVDLFLEKIEYGGQCKIKYIAPQSYTAGTSRVSSVLNKLNGSSL